MLRLSDTKPWFRLVSQCSLATSTLAHSETFLVVDAIEFLPVRCAALLPQQDAPIASRCDWMHRISFEILAVVTCSYLGRSAESQGPKHLQILGHVRSCELLLRASNHR